MKNDVADTCILLAVSPKLKWNCESFQCMKVLATISLTFTSQAGNSKDTSKAATAWNSPSQQNLENKPYLRFSLWQTTEIPFFFLCQWLPSVLAFTLSPQALQPTSNLTYQDWGGDRRNQRSLEDIYISSCNYLAEIIIDIKKCWYPSSCRITKLTY